MENLFDELLKVENFKNFTYNWSQNFQKNYENLISNSTKPEHDAILESLKLFLSKANQFNFENFSYTEIQNQEETFFHVADRLLQKLDHKTCPDINKLCIEFISFCLNERNLMILNGMTLRKFLINAKNSNVFSKFSSEEWYQVIALLKNSSLSILGKEPSEELDEKNEEYSQYRSNLYTIWRNSFENLIDYISSDMFVKSLIPLQDLYETSMLKATSNNSCPYESLCRKILYVRDRTKDLKSLYITLLTQNETHLADVLLKIKQALTKQNKLFNSNPINAIKRELEYVLNFEAQKSGSLFEKYYKLIFTTVMDAFLQVTSNEARSSAFGFIRAVIENTIKIKKHDIQFQVWLIDITRAIADKIKKDSPEWDESYQKFCDLFYWIEHYIRTSCNNRACLRPAIDLILSGLNLAEDNSCLKLVGSLLGKSNFYVFKDHIDKLKEILSKLIYLAHQYATIPENTERDSYEFASSLKSCFDSFTDQIIKQPICLNAVQGLLLNDLIIPTIDADYDSKDYYWAISKAIDLLDLASFKNENDLSLIKKIFDHISSEDIFQSIQPDLFEFYHPRNMFYLQLIRMLNSIFQDRNDIVSIIENSLVTLLERVNQANSFTSAFDPSQLTINYYIVLAIGTALTKNNSNKTLLRCFICNLIQLYKEQHDNFSISSLFVTFIQSIYENNAELLSEFRNDFWKFLIEFELNREILLIIQGILPYSIDLFNEQYASKLLVKLEESTSNHLLTQLLSIFKSISSIIPLYYFGYQENSNHIRLIEFYNICQKSNSAIFYYEAVIILANLASNQDIKSNEIGLLFENREIFLNILFNDVTKLVLTQIGMNFITILAFFCPAYQNIGLKIIDESPELIKISNIVDDLIGIYAKLSLTDGHQASILSSIRTICFDENRHLILKNRKEFFEKCLNNEKDSRVKEILNNIIDLIEGRSIQMISEMVTENAENIDKLSSTVNATENQVSSLKTVVKRQELKVTNIKVEVGDIKEKVNVIDERLDEQDIVIDTLHEKTLLNIPLWGRELAKKLASDWVTLAQHLNFSNKDIESWSTQADPFTSMLQEWFTINKTSDATEGLVKVLKELNKNDCVQLITDSLTTALSNIDLNDDIDDTLINSPPQIFISSTLTSKIKAELLQKYLKAQNFDTWLDLGQMGGGETRNKRIDVGLRASKLVLCFITSDFSTNEVCLRQVNLAVQLNKPIIPLLVEQGIKWPPAGSLGPILSEYLFIRFYQRPAEVTNDERYWPIDKFEELKMQLLLNLPSKISPSKMSTVTNSHPLVFLSYQWDKQKQIINLYTKLESIGLTCWLDIKQMGGGDSLYDKIDIGIRNSLCVVSCVTQKYALSANCRKEVALADSISKPIIPILLQPGFNYPPPGPMSPTLATISYIDFTNDLNEQNSWSGDNFTALLERIKMYMPNEAKQLIDDYLKKNLIRKRWRKANNAVQIVHGSRACCIS